MSLKLLQRNAGVNDDGDFGPLTFKAASKYLDLPNPIAAVHFFAQCAHETGGFKKFKESLYYKSVDRLWDIFKYDFDENKDRKFNPVEKERAQRMTKSPKRLANFVYANQNGNGDEASGDGFKFRGRGAIQLTGRYNYQKFSEYLKDPMVMEDPKRVAEELSFVAAGWFFDVNGIFDMSRDFDRDTIKKITKRINGGYHGLDDRIKLTLEYAKFIK